MTISSLLANVKPETSGTTGRKPETGTEVSDTTVGGIGEDSSAIPLDSSMPGDVAEPRPDDMPIDNPAEPNPDDGTDDGTVEPIYDPVPTDSIEKPDPDGGSSNEPRPGDVPSDDVEEPKEDDGSLPTDDSGVEKPIDDTVYIDETVMGGDPESGDEILYTSLPGDIEDTGGMGGMGGMGDHDANKSTVHDDNINGKASKDNINGKAGNDHIVGLAGNDNLKGDLGNDVLDGGIGQDKLNGGKGNDTIVGGNDNDVLIGGSGHDRLIGGAGKDLLKGGTGNDVFAFEHDSDSGSNSTSDTINDFKVGQDKIDLAKIALPATTNFTFIGAHAFDADDATGQVRLVKGMLYVSTDVDASAELTIKLTGVKELTATDLILTDN